MKEKILKETLMSCFSDWEGDFDVDLCEEDAGYFSVVISHRFLGNDFHMTCNVDDDGICTMTWLEDDYVEVNKENVFASMWFDCVSVR